MNADNSYLLICVYLRSSVADPFRPYSSSSSESGGSDAGDEITYFSEAQLPRSMSRQRSLQNGNSGSDGCTSTFLQIGHFIRKSESAADGHPAPVRSRLGEAVSPRR